MFLFLICSLIKNNTRAECLYQKPKLGLFCSNIYIFDYILQQYYINLSTILCSNTIYLWLCFIAILQTFGYTLQQYRMYFMAILQTFDYALQQYRIPFARLYNNVVYLQLFCSNNCMFSAILCSKIVFFDYTLAGLCTFSYTL